MFALLEAVTIVPAAKLTRFARVRAGHSVLDVGCGTGVVAVTAARLGARVWAVDPSAVLLEHAKANAFLAATEICLKEADIEHLPYEDAAFDVVLSQFGHMFAPHPDGVLAEMLRVLKPAGTLAFSTWPPENFVGQMLALIGGYLPPPGAAPLPLWGDPNIVRKRLGESVANVVFDRQVMPFAALSPRHYRNTLEKTHGPMVNLVARLKGEPARLAAFRSEFDALIERHLADNVVRQHYLMTRATKR